MSDRSIPARPGPGARSRRMAQILRVDQAGEVGAVYIYRGQRAVLDAAPGRSRIRDQLADMEAHEVRHLDRLNQLLTEKAVRPTVLSPFWRAAGFTLGVGTALLGEKAAHACTEAVESVIEAHYAGQIAELAEREPVLSAELSGFRDEELAHRDQAMAEGARDAPGYGLLSYVIRAGCRAAIRLSEVI
jgi:3-demethoxyubiquinol 3-hydroxylase